MHASASRSARFSATREEKKKKTKRRKQRVQTNKCVRWRHGGSHNRHTTPTGTFRVKDDGCPNRVSFTTPGFLLTSWAPWGEKEKWGTPPACCGSRNVWGCRHRGAATVMITASSCRTASGGIATSCTTSSVARPTLHGILSMQPTIVIPCGDPGRRETFPRIQHERVYNRLRCQGWGVVTTLLPFHLTISLKPFLCSFSWWRWRTCQGVPFTQLRAEIVHNPSPSCLTFRDNTCAQRTVKVAMGSEAVWRCDVAPLACIAEAAKITRDFTMLITTSLRSLLTPSHPCWVVLTVVHNSSVDSMRTASKNTCPVCKQFWQESVVVGRVNRYKDVHRT